MLRRSVGRSDPAGWRRTGSTRRLSVASRLAIAVIVVAASAIATASAIGLVTGTRANDRLTEKRLVAAVSAERFEVQAALTRLRSQIGLLATSPSTADSIERLRAATAELTLPSPAVLADQRDSLRDQYLRSVIPELERTVGGDLDITELVPDSAIGVHLQHAFSSGSADPDGRGEIDLPEVDADWAELHAEIHSFHRRTAARLGADDLLLIDPDGTVLYSVTKAPDFATNVAFGPHGTGPLGQALRTKLDPGGTALITELATYAPALGRPTWFIVAPIPLDDGRTAALAVRFGVDALHDVLGGADGSPIALGETGELHLAGPDNRKRTDPRSFREDPRQYLADAEAAGTIDASEAAIIGARGTTALVTRTDGDAVAQALELGDLSPLLERTDHLGRQTLVIAAPLRLAGIERGDLDQDDLEWVVVAQITAAEAGAPLDRYRQRLLVLTAALVVVVTFAGMAWANRLASPLRTLTDHLTDGGRTETLDDAARPAIAGPTGSPDTDDTPAGPRVRSSELVSLVDRFHEMDRTLEAQRRAATQAHETWLATLRSLLPAHLVRRVDGRDEITHDVAPAATVVVLVAHDLDEVTPTEFDELLAHIDVVGQRRDVERIAVLGDTIVTVVGHRSPILDHARRAVLFADELLRSPIGSARIRLAAGVASGAVLTGLSGPEHLVYDVWGPTATRAHRVVERAAPGALELDPSTAERLPADLIGTLTTGTSP